MLQGVKNPALRPREYARARLRLLGFWQAQSSWTPGLRNFATLTGGGKQFIYRPSNGLDLRAKAIQIGPGGVASDLGTFL